MTQDSFVTAGGITYFAAGDGEHGVELWKTDGATTALVSDIRTGVASSDPQDLTPLGSDLSFAAIDGAGQRRLWKTDGGAVVQVGSGLGLSRVDHLTAIGGQIYFSARDVLAGQEVWRTDGTTTTRLTDINPGTGDASPAGFTAYAGAVFFSANDGTTGQELWRLDGTIATRVADIFPDAQGSAPAGFAVVGDRLLFSAHDGLRRNLWSHTAPSAPTAIGLTNSSIVENAPAGTPVGTLVTTDPDAGDTFTYTLVAGAGDSGNAAFEVVDNTLRARAALNFERQSSLSIRVRVADQGGLSLEPPLTVQVTDVDEAPVVDHIVPPANGSYQAGQPLRFTAVTTQPVTRVGRGMPDIGLVVGRAAQKATLVGGLGTNRLTFQYVPARGANDADGVTLGGTIRMPDGAFLRDAQGRRFSLAVPAARRPTSRARARAR